MSCAVYLRALDALEIGNQREAVDILLAALEGGRPAERRYRCATCGLAFEWPGLLDHHERFSHLSVTASELQRAA